MPSKPADEGRPVAPTVLVVGAAYLVQGLVAAVGVLMLGRLAQLGLPLEAQVGILASGAVPWILKFVVALLLDLGPSWPLRLRGLVLAVLQGGAALCLWALASAWGSELAPASISTIATGWIALNLAVALQDVLVDGLALDTLAGHRAQAAAAMGLGHALGAGMLGPLVLGGRIVERGMHAGLDAPAWWVAGLALIPAVALWPRGQARPTKARAQLAAQRPREAGDLARLVAVPVLFAALLFGASATSTLSYEFLFAELRFDYAGYARLILPVGAFAGIAGALGWGPLVSRLGPARASVIASVGLGLAWLSFAAASPLWAERGAVALLAGAEGVLQSALLVGLHALALAAAARSPLPTTAFVLAMAALNLPRVLAPLVAVELAGLGWVGVFAALGAAQLVVSAGLWPLRDWSVDGGPRPRSQPRG